MDDLRCQYCNRDFLKRDHLFRHERVHTKEKPYYCPTCYARFARKDVLKRHERSHARSASRSVQTASVNNDASDSSLNHQLPETSAPHHVSETSTLMGLPIGRLMQSTPLPHTYLRDELWDSTLMTDPPALLDGILEGLSDASLPSIWIPANQQAGFDAGLGAWAIPSGVLPTSTSHSLLSASAATGDTATMPSSSLGLWNEINPTCSDQTTVSGLLDTSSKTDEVNCKQNKKDRRTRLVEDMHIAWATRWCMSDFKMSVDLVKLAEEDTLATERSTLRVHRNLTTPMTFDHNLSPNPRFMKVCFNHYVEIFWSRFPIIHLPSLAPSWENNHLLFFSMCVIGSVFAGSRDALDFGNRLRERIGFLIMAKWKSIMSSNSSPTNQMIIILIQMHLDLHSLLVGDSELLAQSVSHLGSVVLWARRAGILQDLTRRQPSEGLRYTVLQDLSASELYTRWRDWVDEEMKLRVSYTLAIIDSDLSLIFFQPPLVKFRPEQARALASDALFAAQTADEWRDVAQMEASQNAEIVNLRSLTVPIEFTRADELQNTLVGMIRPEMGKHHWLERILSIENLATEISVRRSGLFDETEIFLHQDAFLRRLVECLPPLFANQSTSIEDNIRGAMLTDKPGSIPEENLEANILWHSTFISLYIDRGAIERYHGSEGTQTAQSTHISLPPAVVVGLVLHCLVIRCLAQKYSQGRHRLPIFVSRSVLLAGMVLNWYQDQKKEIFGNQGNSIGEGPDEAGGLNVAASGSSPVRFEDWINRLNLGDPFMILIQNQSTQEKLQSTLDAEDVIFSMATALRQSNGVHGKYSSFAQCLEILANYEMGLDVLENRSK